MFLLKTASNAKTDKIFAYCVLQVGIYWTRAARKWSQKSIWNIFEIFNFSHFWTHFRPNWDQVPLCSDQSEQIWGYSDFLYQKWLETCSQDLSKTSKTISKLTKQSDYSYKSVRPPSAPNFTVIPELKWTKLQRRIFRIISDVKI